MANWLWPCPGNNTITSGVGPRWGRQHKGIDISAPRGATIVASRSGEIKSINTNCTHNYSKNSSCGCGGGYGNFVYIDHKDGYVSRYAHMTDVRVNVGQRVHQGQVIGTVGSTGYSTGNHLHFEVRKGETIIDPETLVSPSNTINFNPKESAESTDIARTYPSSAEYSSEIISAINSASFTNSRPLYPYVRIMLGDNELELKYEHGKPSIIQRFEITKLAKDGAGAKASFVLFDTNWMEIELFLAEHYDKIHIQYGYSESTLQSMKYKMMLQDYSIDFLNTGTLLSIEAIAEGAIENLTQGSISTNTKNPTEAIKFICKQQGWKVDDKNFVSTETVDREEDFKYVSGYPGQYIVESIIPEAKTADGEILVFYVDSDDEKTAHLVSVTYEDSLEVDNSIKTYIYQKGINSVVKELYVNINGVFGGTSNFVATGLSSSAIGMLDKEEFSSQEDQDTVSTTASGLYSWTLKNQSIAQYSSSGESRNQLSNKLVKLVKNSTLEQVEATMTILGDPELNLLDKVRLIIVNDSGDLHYLSGVYIIMGITDSIDNGTYLTQLKLQCVGNINGIEMRNPRLTKK